MLVRYPDWPSRLSSFLSNNEATRFSYGLADCGLWTADAILAMTGTDLAASFRGRYQTRKDLLRVVKEQTGKPCLLVLSEQITAQFELPAITPLCAQRGDLILLKRPGDYSLALVGLDGSVLGISSQGYASRPLTDAHRAWRV